MNPCDLMEAMGAIDDTWLVQCEEYTAQLARRRMLLRRTAAGICAVLALTVGLRMLPVLERGQDSADPADPVETEAAVMQSQDSDTDTAMHKYGAVDDFAYVTDVLPEAEEEAVVGEAELDAAAGESISDVFADVPADVPAADAVGGDQTVVTQSTASGILPLIPLEEMRGDFGFEGILLYADDVHCNYNLLDRCGTPETLPVYKNLATYDLSGKPVYLDDDTMLAMGSAYAAKLGFAVLSYETGYSWDEDEEDIPGDIVILQTTGGEIQVQGNGFATVDFAEPIALSCDQRLSGETTDLAAEKTTAYLWELYGMLLDGNYGQYSLTNHRSFNGDLHRDFGVFSVSDDVQMNYFNASFANLRFYPGETDDTLGGISIRNQAGALEKLGDYPLISEEEATELLLSGESITTVPAEYLPEGGITEDDILSCELEYRVSNLDTYYIPYYHYYVKLDRFPENYAQGLESYGGYWVPAVHVDYLAPTMTTNGSFN